MRTRPVWFSLRPRKQWNKLARKHNRLMAWSYVGSPIIDLNGHQYMQVDYIGSFDTRYPYVRVRRSIVLRDGLSVDHDREAVRRVTELAVVARVHCTTLHIVDMESFAAHRQAFLAGWVDDPIDRTAWYRQHQPILARYVPEDLLASFVTTCEHKQDARERRAYEAARMLRVLNATLQGQPVPSEQIRALDCLYLRAQAWDLRNTQLFLRGSLYAGLLRYALSERREEWMQDQQAAAVCEQALADWALIAERGEQFREVHREDELTVDHLADRYATELTRMIARRMAVYKAPLDGSGDEVAPPEEPQLQDADLERIVSGTPPLPKWPPWRPSRVTRAINWILFVISLAMYIAAIGLFILRWIAIGLP